MLNSSQPQNVKVKHDSLIHNLFLEKETKHQLCFAGSTLKELSMGIKILDINFCWLAASDLKMAKKFYAETLGLFIGDFKEQYSWMELGTQNNKKLMGVAGSSDNGISPIKPGQNAIITFTVEDIISAKEHLEKQGVVFVGDIIEIPNEVKMALFLDPDGNKLQLVETLDLDN